MLSNLIENDLSIAELKELSNLYLKISTAMESEENEEIIANFNDGTMSVIVAEQIVSSKVFEFLEDEFKVFAGNDLHLSDDPEVLEYEESEVSILDPEENTILQALFAKLNEAEKEYSYSLVEQFAEGIDGEEVSCKFARIFVEEDGCEFVCDVALV